MDNHSKELRSYNMSRIKSKNTKPEIVVRKYLFSRGFRYRKNVDFLPGKPDIVLSKYKTCIFINGCFWHKHEGCKYFVWPKSNVNYWQDKIMKNVKRDKLTNKMLQQLGWRVIVIWECELKKEKLEGTLDSLYKMIKNQE